MRELLHNSAAVMRLVENGETVTLTKRGKPVADVTPHLPAQPRKIQWPDIEARAKSYSGGEFLTAEQAARIIAEGRGDT